MVMKELSIEEKAKAYDELLKKLQEAKEDNDVCDERYCCVIDDIVPELKESESEDEKIRKRLIEFFKDWGKTRSHCWSIYIPDILAWLDKQGEQKHWSEEDEEIRNNCIYWLEKARKYFEKDEDLIYDKKWIVKCTDWLKYIRPQTTWKPSEEQIGALEHFVRSIAESGFASPYDSNTKLVYSLLNDLKKLREE